MLTALLGMLPEGSAAGGTGAPSLELSGVTKVYPGPPAVTALAGVSLTIRSGEMAAVVGPSGSGKSTLLNLMGGLDRPTSGSVKVAGLELTGLGDRALSGMRAQMIGFVFQEFYLLPKTSALDNAAEGLRYRGAPGRVRRQLAEESLRRVGLGRRLHHLPNQLSGGERQRVAIARALAGRPAVVFADEPTGNLDSAAGREITDLLVELNEEGATIVTITHDAEVASRFPCRIRLHDGLVVGEERG